MSTLFQKAIKLIRARNKNAYVTCLYLKRKLKLGYAQSAELKTELVEAGVLKSFSADQIEKFYRNGNILWENLNLFDKAKKIVSEYEKIAPSLFMRRLNVDRSKAMQITNFLEKEKIIGKGKDVGLRKVLKG